MNEIVLPEKNAFNALRFICCIVIIIGHCLDLSGLSSVVSFRPVFDMHVCVCVFFILSGFFVTRSYLQKKENGEGVLKFYKRRALRILPSYYFVVSLCAVCFFSLSGCSAKEYFCSRSFWKYVFWNVMLLNFICPSPLPKVNGGGYVLKISAVNGALWTIKIEVAFYLILPLVVFVIEKIKTRRGKNIFLGICYLLSVLWNFTFLILGKKYNSPFVSDLAHQFPGFISCFSTGIICVYNWEFFEKNINKILLPALVVFALHYFTRTEILMPFALTIFVIWFGLRLKFLSFVGQKADFSFGMYLTHFPIIQFCVCLGYFEYYPVFAMLLVMSASFAMAYLMNFSFGNGKRKTNIKGR